MKPEPATEPAAIVTEGTPAEGPSPLVEHIVEASARPRGRALELPSGRTVEARAEGSGDERVTVRSASGEVELEVRMTERGPLLRFRAADIELSAAGDVRVDCDRFEVKAARAIEQASGGTVGITAAGDAAVQAGGGVAVSGRRARVEAQRGNVEIKANDDVELLGERIKLNC